MTPAERLMAERDRIQREAGFYITPCRMAHLMEAAGKVTNLLVKADTNISYQECKIMLGIVETSIASVIGGNLNA